MTLPLPTLSSRLAGKSGVVATACSCSPAIPARRAGRARGLRNCPWIFAVDFASILLGGLSAGTVLFIVSVGLSVTMGLMGFVNLAHGAFAMFGGYVIVLAMNRAHIGFAAALALGFVATAALSVVLERLLYRRLYRAGELDQVLFTIGLIFIFIAAITDRGRPGKPTASVAAGARRSARPRLHAISHLQHLPDRGRIFDRGRHLARLRAHADRRPDPRHGRQSPHGGIARHQCRSAVHHHLRLRQRHGGNRRRARRRVFGPRSAIRAQISGVFPDRGVGRRARQRGRRLLRLAAARRARLRAQALSAARAAPSSSTRSPFCSCCGGRKDFLEGKRRERRRLSSRAGGRCRADRSSGGPRPDQASPSSLVGSAALARRHRLLFRLSRLSRLRRRAADHDPVRALARPCARLCRHHHAWPCGVLRRRSLYGRIAGLSRHLDRADHELAARRIGGGRGRPRLGPRLVAHPGPHAAHAHALHHGAAARRREHGARLYRRLRRPPEPSHSAGVRRVRIQPALRQHAISLQPRRPADLLSLRAHARLFAVRPKPDRHPRKSAAHACGRIAGAAPAGHLLHHLGGDRRHRRRPVGADQRLRQSQRARSRPRRDRAHHSHSRRLWAALRRVRRRRRLPGAGAFPGAHLSDRLAARPRAACWS